MICMMLTGVLILLTELADALAGDRARARVEISESVEALHGGRISRVRMSSNGQLLGTGVSSCSPPPISALQARRPERSGRLGAAPLKQPWSQA